MAPGTSLPSVSIPCARSRGGALVFSNDRTLQEELSRSQIRIEVFQAFHAAEVPAYQCIGCGGHLYPRLSKLQQPHWAHIAGQHASCPFGEERPLRRHELDAQMHQGRQEGERHRALVKLIIALAQTDARIDPASIRAGEYVRASLANSGGRYPDVYFHTGSRQFAIEVQVSPISLHRICERAAFYRANDVTLIWVVSDFDPAQFHRTWVWDLIAAQGDRILTIDEDALAEGERASTFLLRERDLRVGRHTSKLVDALSANQQIQWHAAFKQRWVDVAVGDWHRAFSLVEDVIGRLSDPSSASDMIYSLTRVINVLIAIERWEPVGTTAQNPIAVVHGLLNSADGQLAYKLVRAALGEYRPDALSVGKTQEMIRRCKDQADANSITAWGRKSVVGQVRELLFPDWRLLNQ